MSPDSQSLTEGLELLVPQPKRLLLSQPFNVLLLIATVLSVLPLFFWTQGIGIQIFKTYFFLMDGYWCRAISILLVLEWIVYYLRLKKLRSKYLTWAHLVPTLVGISILILDGKWAIPPSRPYEPRDFLFEVLLRHDVRELSLSSWKTIMFILAQGCLAVNVFSGVFAMKKNRRQ